MIQSRKKETMTEIANASALAELNDTISKYNKYIHELQIQFEEKKETIGNQLNQLFNEIQQNEKQTAINGRASK